MVKLAYTMDLLSSTMAQRPEDQPRGDYNKEVASHSGFTPIAKGEPLWRDLSRSIGFIITCYDRETGGFAQVPSGRPTILGTRMALHSLWWAHAGLAIDDAIPRFKEVHGEDAFKKTAVFVVSNFRSEQTDRNGEVVQIAGFIDPNDGVDRLGLATTYEGLQALFSLDRMMGLEGTLEGFETAHPGGLSKILNLVENNWVQIDEKTGAFTQGAHFPRPDIWGTHAALEIIALASVHRFEKAPDETRAWVLRVKQLTPQIFNYLRSVEYPDGGFGFVPQSGIPNILSLNQVTEIVDRLFFFNHPGEEDDCEARQAFLTQYKFRSSMDGILHYTLSMQDPSTGAFAGYRTFDPGNPWTRPRYPEERSPKGSLIKDRLGRLSGMLLRR